MLSALFGRRRHRQRTTFRNPLRIPAPRLGLLNLLGASGAALAESDRQRLASAFDSSQLSTDASIKCDVLFLYCSLDAQGRIAGSALRVRDYIKSAGAYVAVVATENAPESYMKALQPKNDWGANVVMVINRKGDTFALFFGRLFEAMHKGQSMLMAWVDLAPQAPGYDHPDAPGALMIAEAGHVVFGS